MNTKNNEFTNFKKAIFQLEVWFFNVEMWKSELAKKNKNKNFSVCHIKIIKFISEYDIIDLLKWRYR